MISTGPRQSVICAECSALLMRRLLRPSDGAPIAHFFCDNTCKGRWQRRARPISREELRRLYVDDGKSTVDIAKIVGRNSKRVWEWLRDDGVATRPRGSNPNLHFKKKGHKLGVGRVMPESHRQALRRARLSDGSKSLFPNGVHILKGRTGDRHPRFKGGLTPERQAFYGSEEWKKACAEVWRRADARCERCGLDHRTIDRSQTAFHVHHIVSFQVRELRAQASNLVLLCAPCHRFVHSRANVDREMIGGLDACA